MVFLGNRIDGGVAYTYSKYWENISNNSFGKDGHADLNTFRTMFIAEAGYNRMITPCSSIGVTVAPLAGGIVFHRRRASDNPEEGPHKLAIAYAAVSPCLSMYIGRNQSIGVSVDLVAALLDVRGFESIENRDGTAFPGKVTNNGWDLAPGIGVRLGWMMQVNPCISVGLAYRSQTFMLPFTKYKGLLTPKGRANLPQRIDFGISFQPCCSTIFAVDVGKVYYNQIRTWSGPAFDRDKPFWGAKQGPGLGWKNQYVLKVGASHRLSSICPNLTGRIGFNYGDSPIPRSRTNNSNSTPATTRYHATAGLTWCRSACEEWSLSYAAGIRGSVRGTDQSIPINAGGGKSDLSSVLHEFQISYGHSW